MKSIIIATVLLLNFCLTKQEVKLVRKHTSNFQQHKKAAPSSLYRLDFNPERNLVTIVAPKKSAFKLPDPSAKISTVKFLDFNADKKKDVLVNLGACGTGGCMYGLFLRQYDNYYKLVFMNYLKNMEFKIQKNGSWNIQSSEEIEAYNPSKLQVTIFKFDKKKYTYKVDSTYIFVDN